MEWLSRLFVVNQPVNKQQGFTLLETLVSIFVFSIGLLGMVQMQTVSTALTQQSYAHTQTLYIVNRLINIIDIYDTANGANAKLTTPPSSISDCLVASITVANEISCFYKKLADHLPHATATIAENNNGILTITVYWFDKTKQNHRDNHCPPSAIWSDSSLAQQPTLIWPADNKPNKRICMTYRQWQIVT